MNLEKQPWQELIGDDIVIEFLLIEPGAEKVEWRVLSVVANYLEEKFGFLTRSFLQRFNDHNERRAIFQLLETKMPGKFKMFLDKEIARVTTNPPQTYVS